MAVRDVEGRQPGLAANDPAFVRGRELVGRVEAAGVQLELDDFQRISNRTPLFVDLKPGGHFVAVDVDKAGGIGVIAQRLVEGKYVDGSALTCTGKTFAEEAAKRKATIKGITLSREQLAYAEQRIAKAGLAKQASFHFEDYRDTTGSFNGIASIEMIEAVGEPHWPTYFRTLYDRLKPGGIAAIQGITISEANYETYRSGVDFIQRYIFPGGMLLTKTILKEQAAKAGLVLERVETFGQSYATTLRLWHERFEAVWPEVAKLGFDEKFRRLWKLYLAYCEAGFAESVVDVGIYKLRKPA